jgi:transposase
VHDRHDLTEEEWAALEPLLPDQTPRRGGRWADHRSVINGVLWRTRTSSPWRDLPRDYGHWKTIYNRHRRWSADGTWAKVLDELRRGCDQSTEAGPSVEWSVGVDSTVVRAHQHAAGAPHTPPPHLAVEDAVSTEADTRGWVE